jgi:hypothetical protein
MNLKTMLLVNTVVAAVFGLALVLVPGTVIATYGVTVDAGILYMGQVYGAALVGIAVLCWFAKGAPVSEAGTAIFRALFVFNVVALVVSVVAQLNHVMNAVGWSAVAIYLLFTLGWAYFLWAKPAA